MTISKYADDQVTKPPFIAKKSFVRALASHNYQSFGHPTKPCAVLFDLLKNLEVINKNFPTDLTSQNGWIAKFYDLIGCTKTFVN